ncbi:hypothetical protein JZO77_04510 [Enterococcus hulanensis]|uniref:hypothetical protein n=1 Tax=Enterococcus hulanensis TaxID=2559929 RepID=UPI001A8EE382|nr:hypothetical protein [Enterococcus hulanensis]MBO0455998.1 hypothetical protein [Enterococcus hulanensis]
MDKGIVIIGTERYEKLAEKIEEEYQRNNFIVYKPDCNREREIEKFFKMIGNEKVALTNFFYFSGKSFYTSILKESYLSEMKESINETFLLGALWIKCIGNYLHYNKLKGKMIILAHISSIVPSKEFSYCSIGEAALVNFAKVAILDTHDHTDLQINFITHGWLESEKKEKEWKEQLDILHKDDKSPIVECITDNEVLEACRAVDVITAMNGSNVILDKGYSISRTIKSI